MVNSKYAKAYTEVLEIISYFPQEAYNKIPSEKINFYKQNMDKNYKNIEETISTGYSIVILWKKKMDIKNANYQEIKQDMDNIIVKAKLNSNKENI